MTVIKQILLTHCPCIFINNSSRHIDSCLCYVLHIVKKMKSFLRFTIQNMKCNFVDISFQVKLYMYLNWHLYLKHILISNYKILQDSKHYLWLKSQLFQLLKWQKPKCSFHHSSFAEWNFTYSGFHWYFLRVPSYRVILIDLTTN